ncbi:phiSA1p31-related protein [Streptomyces sp. DSM 42041]|uniref:PhiSA1p31-related protein n=1 Tax=Streptomyces hazeniae TaxID=3075538 RepID=A0ABU2NYV3_9ACTN|nr:phiSA1p31-related protein [Streptomyces sp. DSM 42041]MDT0381383.1 phiSA1p31-related protein [Streptomyces sp. DSM 42041]
MNEQYGPTGPPRGTAFVLIVHCDGTVSVPHSQLCPEQAAAALRQVADHLDAQHTERPCPPRLPDLDPDGPPPETPFTTRGGRLDALRQVWFDGTGHAWDLSLAWGDACGVEWRWNGRLDPTGRVPLMVASVEGETEPLDVVRARFSPMRPVGGAWL